MKATLDSSAATADSRVRTGASNCGRESAPPSGGGGWPAPPLAIRVLAGATHLLPPLPGCGLLGLTAVRKLYRGPRLCQFTVWPGTRMVLDPRDYLGAILASVPHLYDRWERAVLASILRPGDVFVDVGSNIGAYALWAARLVGPSGRVFAVEPDEQNHRMLLANIRLNSFEDRVTVLNRGISDRRESLRMHRNETGNCGGHNFIGRGVEGPAVECLPLHEALQAASVGPARLIKLDIEGFERRVLGCFFENVAPSARPDYLLVEIDDGPASVADRAALRGLIAGSGYLAVQDRGNTLYRRCDVRD